MSVVTNIILCSMLDEEDALEYINRNHYPASPLRDNTTDYNNTGGTKYPGMYGVPGRI